jgi:diacylglycerol kinase
MQESIAMSMTQCFEVERMNRAIEATADPAQLQTLAKQLLHAWQSQRAATQWVMRQQ